MPLAYRVGLEADDRGLWYQADGTFDPIIERLGLSAAVLPMGFDPEMGRGGLTWLSATEKLPEILQWFKRDELELLYHTGYRLRAYEVESYRHVTEPHQHILFARQHIIKATEVDLAQLDQGTLTCEPSS